MTLKELSCLYADDAQRLQLRIHLLRQESRRTPDPQAAQSYRRRMNALLEMQRDMNALTRLTRHYYDSGVSMDPDYRL